MDKLTRYGRTPGPLGPCISTRSLLVETEFEHRSRRSSITSCSGFQRSIGILFTYYVPFGTLICQLNHWPTLERSARGAERAALLEPPYVVDLEVVLWDD